MSLPVVTSTNTLSKTDIATAVVLLATGKFKVSKVEGLYNLTRGSLYRNFKRAGMESPSFYKKGGLKMLSTIKSSVDDVYKTMGKYRLYFDIYGELKRILNGEMKIPPGGEFFF